MRKRDELTDPTSCMSRAREDEWTFVLLGRDRAAPVAVRAWIEERVRLGKNLCSDPQIVEAEQWIAAVEAEQAASGASATAPQLTPSLLRLAADFLDAYADRLGNDGCNDWKWPADLTAAERSALAGHDYQEHFGDLAPPNWLAVRHLAMLLRGREVE